MGGGATRASIYIRTDREYSCGHQKNKKKKQKKKKWNNKRRRGIRIKSERERENIRSAHGSSRVARSYLRLPSTALLPVTGTLRPAEQLLTRDALDLRSFAAKPRSLALSLSLLCTFVARLAYAFRASPAGKSPPPIPPYHFSLSRCCCCTITLRRATRNQRSAKK